MAKCSFCRKIIEPGTGLMYVKNDGRIFNFCSKKCEKNLLIRKHVPRLTKWSKAYIKGTTAKKEATQTTEEPKQ